MEYIVNRFLNTTCYVALALIASCNKEEIINRPVFQLTMVSGITLDGAKFTGNIDQLTTAYGTQYGFSWGTNPKPTVNQETFYFDQKPSAGTFTQNINYSWEPNLTYYARAFLKGPGGVIYSDNLSFNPVAQRPLEITDFSPKSGKGNFAITITGKFLNQAYPGDVKLVIGGLICYATSVTSTSVTIHVPAVDYSGIYFAELLEGAYNDEPMRASLPDSIILLGPIVNSVNPVSGPAGTSVTISGSGFSTTPSLNDVHFFDDVGHDCQALVTTSTQTQLTIIIPACSPGDYRISVSVGGTYMDPHLLKHLTIQP
jgi:hypothetical protein